MATIKAPWTAEQVNLLNQWQAVGSLHAFTCGNDWHGDEVQNLVATPDGWVCPHERCSYTQDWCHDYMADGIVLQEMKQLFILRESQQ